MTNQTHSRTSLTGSPAGGSSSRWCTLAVVILAGATMMAGHAQEQPAKQPTTAAKPTAPKPLDSAAGKTMGGYQVHSMVDLGGRFAEKNGSRAMWATLVNQSTGARVLGQDVHMHTLDPHRTPFFDS